MKTTNCEPSRFPNFNLKYVPEYGVTLTINRDEVYEIMSLLSAFFKVTKYHDVITYMNNYSMLYMNIMDNETEIEDKIVSDMITHIVLCLKFFMYKSEKFGEYLLHIQDYVPLDVNFYTNRTKYIGYKLNTLFENILYKYRIYEDYISSNIPVLHREPEEHLYVVKPFESSDSINSNHYLSTMYSNILSVLTLDKNISSSIINTDEKE